MKAPAVSPLFSSPAFAAGASWVRPATVLAGGTADTYHVALDTPGTPRAWATMAMAAAPALKVGSRVLVTGEDLEACYVIGVLDTLAERPSERRLTTRAGASVAVVEDGGRERIQIRDASSALVVEVDAATGRTLVQAAHGNLALAAPNGDVEIEAGGAVRMRGKKEVAIETASLGASAKKVALGFVETSFIGGEVRARLESAKLVADRIERTASRVFERAKSVFRTVEDLDQTKAGRVRSLVSGGWFTKAGHASLDATEEVRIDGKEINLG